MQRSAFYLLLLLAATQNGHAGDFGAFMTNLNTNWVARNYSGVRKSIADRLVVKTNDLPGLIAQADYYTTIELNMAVVSNVAATLRTATNGINWALDRDAALMLEEMMDSMEHRAQNEQSGFVYGLTSNQLEELRQEFPTNHPSAIILPRFATIQYGSAD